LSLSRRDHFVGGTAFEMTIRRLISSRRAHSILSFRRTPPPLSFRRAQRGEILLAPEEGFLTCPCPEGTTSWVDCFRNDNQEAHIISASTLHSVISTNTTPLVISTSAARRNLNHNRRKDISSVNRRIRNDNFRFVILPRGRRWRECPARGGIEESISLT